MMWPLWICLLCLGVVAAFSWLKVSPVRRRLSKRAAQIIAGAGIMVWVVTLFHFHRWNSGSYPLVTNAEKNSAPPREDAFHGIRRNLSSNSRLRVIDLNGPFLSIADDYNHPFSCVELKTRFGFSVCIYDKKIDVYISSRLIRNGTWEVLISKAFEKTVQLLPHATVIDVGANIGYYSFLAARNGNKVIALEPKWKHQLRFVAAAKLNGEMSGRILLLGNAVSDGHYNVSISSSVDNQGNVWILDECGHQRFLDKANETDQGKKFDSEAKDKCSVQTLILDDLVPIIATSTAILKIDIEGHECRAMRKSKKFFTLLKVPHIFMEWGYPHSSANPGSCTNQDKQQLSNTLANLDYVPYNATTGTKLDPTIASKWPFGNVHWQKQYSN